MEKIIIALDYNPSAQKVAEVGYQFAKSSNAKVALMHIITDPEFYAIEYSPIMGFQGFYSKSSEAIFEQIIDEAKSFLEASANHLGDSNIETFVLQGEPAERILEFAKEYKADMIVLGSHSQNKIKLLHVDIAGDLLKHSDIPLLIIPTNEK
jgi:nucleotide-binding universal stress UspA family protein